MLAKRARKKGHAVTRLNRWQPKFLESLEQTGNVTISAEATGISRNTVYMEKGRDKAFAMQIAESLDKAADRIEHALRERGVNGVSNYIHHQGMLVTVPVDAAGNVLASASDPKYAKSVPLVKREYDTTAAIFLLKGIRPEKYRDNLNHVHHDGDKLTPADGQAEADHILAELRKAFPGTPPKN